MGQVLSNNVPLEQIPVIVKRGTDVPLDSLADDDTDWHELLGIVD